MINYKTKKSASGWHKVKPHTQKQRKKLFKTKGKKCFLKNDELKYPVCDKNGNYDCRGIIAAKFWANTSEIKSKKKNYKRPYSFKKIINKANKLGKKLKCKAFII
tara:strand:- start:219 stop:533 length:315 start_codon:yes stop_codon:yes gene_type:complete